MQEITEITIAAKCLPEDSILGNIEKAGLTAVELYTNVNWLKRIDKIKQTCKKFSFRYAIHAPNDGYEPDLLAELADEINAEVVVFHDIYWEDEWEYISKIFTGSSVKLSIENVGAMQEQTKLMRRFGFKRCLDLEHLQRECAGIFEEEFIPIMKQSSHVHLTGYSHGSDKWHSHIHHSPEQSLYLLNLLKNSGYSGMVVSEAKVSFQTLHEFEMLKKFYFKWKEEAYGKNFDK